MCKIFNVISPLLDSDFSRHALSGSDKRRYMNYMQYLRNIEYPLYFI